jgi:hypothetical protein
MHEYFKLIRQILQEDRKKNNGTYYESHHIVPKSFGKKSSTVLLTPEEHYTVHKYLAEYWKNHSVYGKKMLWAFHRLAYDKGRKLTKEEYAEARKVLLPLWKRTREMSHRERIGLSMKGNTNNSSRVFKGMKSDITEEGRKKLSELASKRQKGKKQWYGGPYTVTFENSKCYTANSFPDLEKLVNISYNTLYYRYVNMKGIFYKGWKIE